MTGSAAEGLAACAIRAGVPGAPAARAPTDDLAVLCCALQRVLQARQREAAAQLLHGKNVALLGRRSEGAATRTLLYAAEGIGARVALLRSAELFEPRSEAAAQSMRFLGRLYDAIVCCGVEPRTRERLWLESGLPVVAPLSLGSPARIELRRIVDDFHARSTMRAPPRRSELYLQAALVAVLG